MFAESDTDLGCFNGIKHKIDTGDAKPIQQPMRRTPIGSEEEEKKHLDSMLESKIIQPSMSDWAAPPVLVRKKNGGVRWCIDYRALNNVTVKDAFPLPRIEECLDKFSMATYMSTLVLASGYWQLEVAEEDRHKTAFITRHGLFEHIRMGFGLCNAPATLTRAMQSVLHGLLWGGVLAYLDDVIVLGLNLKPRKCVLFREEVKFLGKIVSRKGISVNPENIERVSDWPIPMILKNVNEVGTFSVYELP